MKEVADKFKVSHHVVYYWLECGYLKGRRNKKGAPYLITLDSDKEKELRLKVINSSKIKKNGIDNSKTKLKEV